MEPIRRERIKSRVGDGLVAAAEGIRDSLMERVTRPKYEDAARIPLEVLDKRIDALKAKAKATQKDSESLALLKEIKAQIQRELDERWHNRDSG